MHSCKDVRDSLAAFVDGQVDADQQPRIEAHLAQCAACRAEANRQRELKKRLGRWGASAKGSVMPSHVWSNAVAEWDRRDNLRAMKWRFRIILGSAFALLLTLGIVWARLEVPDDFPVAFALSDYHRALNAPPAPALAAADADVAARWLRKRIGADVPALNLSLSDARLVGADVLQTTDGAVGRLLYVRRGRLLALYLSPGHTQFRALQPRRMEERTFVISTDEKQAGLFGWQSNGIGYGLALQQPIEEGESIAIDAQRASDLSQ